MSSRFISPRGTRRIVAQVKRSSDARRKVKQERNCPDHGGADTFPVSSERAVPKLQQLTPLNNVELD